VSRVMLYFDVCRGLCQIATFIKGLGLTFDTLWFLSRVMPHCNVHQGLCWIVRFFNGNVRLWLSFWLTLCEIVVFLNGYFRLRHSPCHVNGYVTLWHSNVILHCDIHWGFYHIVKLIKCDVILWHLLRVLLHCNVHLFKVLIGCDIIQ